MPSLYLHIPFCDRKCPYCDFYSTETRSLIRSFVDAVNAEIRTHARDRKGPAFGSVFFGGGTPSLLEPHQLETLFKALHATFVIAGDAEITVEVNPGTVTEEKLKAYRSLGVNRLSIGIQSFHDGELKFLGRIHDSRQARSCVELAQRAGYENINLDLIFALPGQTLDVWKQNLQHSVALHPAHISAYSLIIEENTRLARLVDAGLVVPACADAEAELYKYSMEFLADHGFEHYEVSNFAQPGFRSRHNYGYWSHDTYLGFGPSAHSFWKEPREATGRRWWNIADVQEYCRRTLAWTLPVAAEEQVGPEELVTERILLGLRSDGIQTERLRADFGFDLLHRQQKMIRELVEEGLAVLENHSLRLTSKGYLLCDEICRRLLG